MSRMITTIGKQLKSMVIVLIMTSAAITLISWIGEFSLPRVFFLVGIIYTLAGVFSCLGNYKISTDIGYQQARSVSLVANYNNSVENVNSRNDFKLLLSSGVTGLALMLISGFLERSDITIIAINLLVKII